MGRSTCQRGCSEKMEMGSTVPTAVEACQCVGILGHNAHCSSCCDAPGPVSAGRPAAAVGPDALPLHELKHLEGVQWDGMGRGEKRPSRPMSRDIRRRKPSQARNGVHAHLVGGLPVPAVDEVLEHPRAGAPVDVHPALGELHERLPKCALGSVACRQTCFWSHRVQCAFSVAQGQAGE